MCPDGKPNALAIQKFRDEGSIVVDLDPGATAEQITKAMCADQKNGVAFSGPSSSDLYTLAKAINGWTFAAFDPVAPDGSFDCA